MKRLLALIIIFSLSLSLYSGIVPVSSRLGAIDTVLEKDSISYRMKEAFTSEFSEEWLAKYTVNSEAFILSYVPLLSSLLPMENLIFGREENNRLSFYSQKSGHLISLILKDGVISALSAELIQ